MSRWQHTDQPLQSRADQRLTALANRNASNTARIATVIGDRLLAIAASRTGLPAARSFDNGNGGGDHDPVASAALGPDTAGQDRNQLVHHIRTIATSVAVVETILDQYGPRLGTAALCERCHQAGRRRAAMGAAPTNVAGRLPSPMWLCSRCYNHVRHTAVAKARHRH